VISGYKSMQPCKSTIKHEKHVQNQLFLKINWEFKVLIMVNLVLQLEQCVYLKELWLQVFREISVDKIRVTFVFNLNWYLAVVVIISM